MKHRQEQLWMEKLTQWCWIKDDMDMAFDEEAAVCQGGTLSVLETLTRSSSVLQGIIKSPVAFQGV